MELAHFEAAMKGNCDIFPFSDINRRDELLAIFSKVTPSGSSLLHVAASSGQVEMTQLIAQHFPFLIAKNNSEGDTALHLAARAGRLYTAKIIVAYAREFANIDHLLKMTNGQGNTALHEALTGLQEYYSMINTKDDTSKEHVEFLALGRDLVSEGREVSYCQNNEGKSPFCLAVECGNKDFLRYLLRTLPEYEGSSVHGPLGNYLVQVIVDTKDLDVLEVIKELKPELLFLHDEMGNTPLHYAASTGHRKAVGYLLEIKSEGGLERNNEGLYPLHVACENGHIQVMKELLRKWPYPSEFLCHKGQTILHVAAKCGKEKVVRYILKQKYSDKLINRRDNDGNTALHLAASHGYSLVAGTLLLNKRLMSDIVNNQGQTAYDISERKYVLDTGIHDGEKDKKALGKVPEQPMYLTSTENDESSGRKYPKCPLAEVSSKQSKEPDLLETNMTFSIFFLRLCWRRLFRCHGSLSDKGSRSIKNIRSKRKPLGKDDVKERINSLLVVSSIIVAATFAASHQLPESDPEFYSEDDEVALADYLLYDNIAMSLSIMATIALCWTQLVDTKLAYLVVLSVSMMLAFALYFMWFAFRSAIKITLNDYNEWFIDLNINIQNSAFCLAALFSLPLILPFRYRWMDFVTTVGYFLFFIVYYSIYRIYDCLVSTVSVLKDRLCNFVA